MIMAAPDFGRIIRHSSDAGFFDLWTSKPGTTVFVVLSVACLLFCLSDFFSFSRDMLSSCFDRRSAVRIEHSISKGRVRNKVSACFLPAFILVADYFRLWDPVWLQGWPESVSILKPLLAVTAIIVWRAFVLLFCPRAIDRDTRIAASRGLANLLPFLVILMVLTVTFLIVFGAGYDTFRKALRVEVAAAILLDIRIEGNILMNSASGFLTFLYLCALEIILVAVCI